MKRLQGALTFLYMVLFTSQGFSQYLERGDLSPLKGISSVNIVYDYTNLAVGEFNRESDYLHKKKKDYADNPDKYEKFLDGWFGARKARYEPKFEKLFNKVGHKSGIHGTNDGTNGQVTLVVKTVFIEPGYNAGPVKKNAYVSMQCTFRKDGREFAVYMLDRVRGGTPSAPMGGYYGTVMMSFDFDAGTRISESYAKAAKMLMKDVTRRLKEQ